MLSKFRLKMGLSFRIAVIFVVGTITFITLFAYLGNAALKENINQTLQERILLAQTTAQHIDYILASIESVLTNTASEENWSTPENIDISLDRAYNRLDFYSTQVFLVDKNARVTASRPPTTAEINLKDFASIAEALKGKPFAVSRFNRPEDTIGCSTIAASPVHDLSGTIIGALVINIDLTGPDVHIFTQPIGLGSTGYEDLIDLGGVVLASSDAGRVGLESDHNGILQGMILNHQQDVFSCNDCYAPKKESQPVREVLAFVPLEHAQWGIVIHQNESEVYRVPHLLQERLIVLMIVIVSGALIMIFLISRSVILPVKAIIAATQRMTIGDLDTPLEIHGHDEISALAHSFDTMRVRLKNSIEEIQAWNRDLDVRVQERTAVCQNALKENKRLYEELQHKERLRSMLLHRVISAQEEERVRISHELHDETCQMLSALGYIIDTAEEEADSEEMRKSLEHMHSMTETMQDDLHRIIMDLRPTMLDHLGLIPALRWYADTRFSSPGIISSVRVLGNVHRLPPDIEITLFRVIQEAINNIARHSNARHANLVFEYFTDRVEVRITDDGEGFDVAGIETRPDENRGLGLIGMSERMSVIGGEFHLRTMPGRGTVITLTVNLGRIDDEKDTSVGS